MSEPLAESPEFTGNYLRAGIYKHSDLLKQCSKTFKPLRSDLAPYEYKKTKIEYPETLSEFEEKYGRLVEPLYEHRDKKSLAYIGIDEPNTRNKSDPWFKKPEEKTYYSQQHQREFIRSYADPLYFIENYCYVESPTPSGLALANLFDYQKEIIWAVHNHKQVIANVARQGGKTTAIACYIVYCLCFKTRFRMGVIAQDEGQAKEIIRRVRSLLETLPDFICPALTTDQAGKLVLENGSSVQGFGSDKGIRGSSMGLLYVDEAAHIGRGKNSTAFNDLIKSLMPIVARWKGNKIVLTSTPKGLNHWYDLFQKPSYYKINADWKQIGERLYDESGRFDGGKSWKKKEIDDNGKLYFDQEFAVKFLGSSKSLISTDFLKSIESTLIDHKQHLLPRGIAYVYKTPVNSSSYVMNVDIASLSSDDFSACTVTDTTNGEIVAQFYDSSIGIQDFAVNVEALGRLYHAWIVVEVTNVSSNAAYILKHLNDSKYPRMYVDEKDRLGVEVNKDTKRLGCELLKTMVEEVGFNINSREVLDELMRFCSNGKTYEGIDFPDDLTMTLVGLNLCLQNDHFRQLVDSSNYGDWTGQSVSTSAFFAVTNGNETIVFDSAADEPTSAGSIETPKSANAYYKEQGLKHGEHGYHGWVNPNSKLQQGETCSFFQ
ncbi:hypothetical protein FA893_18275 [Photobacterium damselae subsp. piscicida]|uniref:terminase large subunit domain-containing protein n=1 Tax=Photobacterium damselae TaxID=38293 RepID=UPI00031C053B|nr:terminase family protein [Photobacterium damselae]OLQ78684.1 hypothetical protein BEI67_18960 [Photobacterium damselae subsp. piscicida]TFZ63940.1 hypothetical protein E4T25_01360 [Photobacterium damselae subsp. piscicida]TJZ82347.1 hypothetical protein FA893_18275 [Photobacterium damselae subsp. piscicida]